MISDTERREVAENLRYLADYPGAPMRYAEQLRDELYGVVFPDGLAHDCYELLQRLADLIEPSEPQVKRELKYRARCDELGTEMNRQRDALLALAVNLDARATELLKVNDLDQSRQRRSARLAHATDLMAACSRIREALGVER